MDTPDREPEPIKNTIPPQQGQVHVFGWEWGREEDRRPQLPWIGIFIMVYGVLLLNFSMNLGFMGFMICWLAGGEPLGILLMSFVVAVITTGGNLLQLTRDLPYAVINILLAFTLFVVLARPTIFEGKKA